MRASVLIGCLVASAVLLLFVPSLERWRGRSHEARQAESLEHAPRLEAGSPDWLERVERKGWLEVAAPAASQRRWTSLQAALLESAPPETGAPASFDRELLSGLAALRLGRSAEALTHLEAATSLVEAEAHPLAAEAWMLLAEAAGAESEGERRLRALARLLELRPDLTVVRVERARALLEAGSPETALELVRGSSPDAGPPRARAALLRVGVEAAGEGSDERRAWISELGWQHGSRAPALHASTDADWKSEFDAALAREDWGLLLDRQEALVVADLAKAAVPELEALLAAGPPEAERDRARLLLGRAWRVRKKHAKGLVELKRVSESDPVRYTRARYNAALAARALKRRGESARLLEQAAAGPTCLWRDRALERLADQDQQAGRESKARARWLLLSREALAAFTQVTTDFPRQHAGAAGLYWSQRLLAEGGAPEEARRRLEQLADDHPWDYYGLLAAQELGRPLVRPLRAGRAELESELAGLLEDTAGREQLTAERAAAEWRTGFPAEVLVDLEVVQALPPAGSADEAGRWALRVALLGESGRHRAALVELRAVLPDWRTRPDVPPLAWAGAYPRAYSELVERHAADVDLDPALVYALIHQESVFDPDAVSHAGARGLMQIMPGTNRTIARWFKERTRTADLIDPEHNVRYGTAYLKRLLDNLEHPELALAGYNAGGTRARRWWKALPEKDVALFVESIPYDETRHYVKSVTWNRHFYAEAGEWDPEGGAREVELR